MLNYKQIILKALLLPAWEIKDFQVSQISSHSQEVPTDIQEAWIPFCFGEHQQLFNCALRRNAEHQVCAATTSLKGTYFVTKLSHKLLNFCVRLITSSKFEKHTNAIWVSGM